MKISIALLALLSLSGCASDYGLGYDCSEEGRNKPIAFDNGAQMPPVRLRCRTQPSAAGSTS